MVYKGAVNYYNNLPLNPSEGDVWVVRYTGSSGTTPNGHAYCWDEEIEPQWIDLGNLSEFLPEGEGKIYYNGICYSGGGGSSSDCFSRTKIANGISNLRSFENSLLTVGDENNYKNNMLFLKDSSIIVNSQWNPTVSGNLLLLASRYDQNEGQYVNEITCDNLFQNFIGATNCKISSTYSLYNSLIFGSQNEIRVESLIGATILGTSNLIKAPSGNTRYIYLNDPIIIGYSNKLRCGSGTNAAFIMLGNNNEIHPMYDSQEELFIGNDSYLCTAMGAYNRLSGYYVTAIGFSNRVGYDYDYSTQIQGSSTYSGAFGMSNYLNKSNYCWIFGYNNALDDTYESVNIGTALKTKTCYDSINIGYYNIANNCSQAYIFGYFNRIQDSNYIFSIGEGIEVPTSSANLIRLGFYPLINDDFFAIGDGANDGARSSIIRIDSSKNIYLNSTVAIPPIPTTDGDYKLHVDDGVATWVAIV